MEVNEVKIHMTGHIDKDTKEETIYFHVITTLKNGQIRKNKFKGIEV